MKTVCSFLTIILFALQAFGQQPNALQISQTVDSLIKVSRTHTNNDFFDKALEASAAAEALSLEKLGPNHAAYGKACFNHGRILDFRGQAADSREDFAGAEKWYLKAAAIQKQFEGSQRLDYAYTISNLASVYNTLGEYFKSEPIFLEALKIVEEELGNQHPHYGLIVNNLALLYEVTGDYERAEPLYLEALKIREASLGKNHPAYGKSLVTLAGLYEEKGAYSKAELLYLEAKNNYLQAYGHDDDHYGNLLLSIGIVYEDIGDFTQAEAYFLEGKQILEKVYGKKHQDYAGAISNLAGLYFELGDYAKAESLIQEAKEIYANTFGKNHPNYAFKLTALASYYFFRGAYNQAEPLFFEARELQIKLLGKDHPHYALTITGLANLYYYTGAFTKAEPLYLEAKEIFEKAYGREHPNYATVLTNLSNLYLSMGNYSKVESLNNESKAIFEKVLGKNHPNYATVLANLGSLYLTLGLYDKAEALFLEAKEIWSKIGGKVQSDYAVACNNLGELYLTTGNYSKAEPMLLDAQKTWETTLGKGHANYGLTLNTLGQLSLARGAFKKAEQLFLESKTIIANALGSDHDYFKKVIINLAALYEQTNRIAEARALLLQVGKSNRKTMEKAIGYFSESQMLEYLKSNDKVVSGFYAFTHRHPGNELVREMYNNTLFYNGLLLENSRKLSLAIANADSLILENYEKWQSCQRRLAKRYSRPVSERKKIEQVEAEADKYEKLLMQDLPGFRASLKIPVWQEVRNQLKQDEAAIEFIHYTFQNDSIMYAALLLRPDWDEPQFIPLCEEKTLDSLLNTNGQRQADYVSRIYSQNNRGVILADAPKKSILELVWSPLEPALKAAKTIYFSPAGLLHRINLAAIPVSLDSVLADRYKLVQMGSSRHLVVPNSANVNNNEAVLFGGLNYDMDSLAIVSSNEKLGEAIADIASSRGASKTESVRNQGDEEYWRNLPYTEREIDAITPLLTKAGFHTIIRKGYTGTEEAFKQFGRSVQDRSKNSPRVLHLATHGYFSSGKLNSYTDSEDTKDKVVGFKDNEHPLMRSGLLLSGANFSWGTGRPLIKGMDNGVLTAYEISHMDLTNTELVVLSACETGLGDIQGNEGVFGLQRAFKTAGVKYLIMSLWKVDDKETSVLMTRFYKKWLEEKMEIPDAFRAAQTELRQLYSPFHWAGFILVE